jgi:hypothetical protein
MPILSPLARCSLSLSRSVGFCRCACVERADRAWRLQSCLALGACLRCLLRPMLRVLVLALLRGLVGRSVVIACARCAVLHCTSIQTVLRAAGTSTGTRTHC